MIDYTKKLIKDSWQVMREQLFQHISEQESQLKTMIDNEEYYRGAHHQKKNIKEELGSFGADTINEGALTTILKDSDKKRVTDNARFERLKEVHAELLIQKENIDKEKSGPFFLENIDQQESVFTQYEEHIENYALLFRALRITELEIKGSYNKEKHVEYFKDFSWQNLRNSELQLCAPFVIFIKPDNNIGKVIGQVVDLVSQGRPFKIFVLQDKIGYHLSESGRTSVLRVFPDIGFAGISLRGIYVHQSSEANQKHLKSGIAAGLKSARPTLFSLFTNDALPEDDFLTLAKSALNTRAFPHFTYDPDLDIDLVKCLDLSENLELNANFVKENLDYFVEHGKLDRIENELTFADFAIKENYLKADFEELPDALDPKVHVTLAEFLKLNVRERIDKVPFINKIEQNKKLKRYVPSRAIITQAVDKADLWRTLQTLAGIENPFIEDAKSELSKKFREENSVELEAQRQSFEASIAGREKEAIKIAMKNLALNLAGLATSSIASPSMNGALVVKDVASKEKVSASDESSTPVQSTSPTDEAWIESALCTACDECITINKNIFKYNGDKQAIFKDVAGGPYRDIVKAAEKCSAMIIHPGKPLDANEKDIEKWVKRAEKYQ